MSTGSVVAVALGLGLGTLALRLVFANAIDRWSLPPRALAVLDVLPAAALAALVAPGLIPANPLAPGALGVVLAAITTGVVAYRTQNLLWSLGAGMAVYWLL